VFCWGPGHEDLGVWGEEGGGGAGEDPDDDEDLRGCDIVMYFFLLNFFGLPPLVSSHQSRGWR